MSDNETNEWNELLREWRKQKVIQDLLFFYGIDVSKPYIIHNHFEEDLFEI